MLVIENSKEIMDGNQGKSRLLWEWLTWSEIKICWNWEGLRMDGRLESCGRDVESSIAII